MVTGVETAGLVLGCLPLLIAALEHYEDMAQPTKEFFWAWRKYRKKLVQELYTLRVSYDEAITLLLKDLTDPDELTSMVDNPMNDMWTIGPIANNLRGCLGHTYDPFLLAIAEITEILGDIAGHLNIQGSQQGANRLRDVVLANPPTAKTGSLRKNFEFTQRVTFTMKKRGMKISLERLEICTNRINTWAERAGRSQDEPAPKRSKLRFVDSLDAIQENASRIYRALSRHWCKQKTQHPASLLLEQRLKRPQTKRTIQRNSIFHVTTNSTHFSLSFDGDCCPSLPRFNTEFKIIEAPSTPSPGGTRVKVSITPSVSQGTPDEDPFKLPLVTGLCQYIRQPAHPSVGFYLDDAGHLRAYSSQPPNVDYVDGCHTLESLLPRLQTKPHVEELYCLAITLVASIFQLTHTPWFDQAWSKSDIAFLRVSSGPYLNVDIKYPYLMRGFSKGERSLATFGPQHSFQIGSGHQNPAVSTTSNDCIHLITLAVLLLEISFGQPIEQMREPADLGNKTTSDHETDFLTANRWYKGEKARLSAGFSTAILTCLQQYLNPDLDLNDPDHFNVVKEKVLQPLEYEMQCMVFGPPQ